MTIFAKTPSLSPMNLLPRERRLLVVDWDRDGNMNINMNISNKIKIKIKTDA